MGGVQTEEVAETKLLGVQLDNCLSWSSQITNLCKKINIKTAGIIRRIAKYLPGKILQQITQALIESQVNYCSVVWGNESSSENMLILFHNIQCLAKVFAPLELCDLLPHFRLQT